MWHQISGTFNLPLGSIELKTFGFRVGARKNETQDYLGPNDQSYRIVKEPLITGPDVVESDGI